MFMKKIEVGENEDCVFIRFGKGKEPLVIFPPLNDALFNVQKFAWHYQHLFKELARDFSVFIMSRKRGMPVGYATRDIAKDYAQIIKPLGPVNVLGISLGGMAAQYFAADYSPYVKRLVLIASAYRMGPEGLEIARRWIPWARMGMWKKIYEETIELSYERSYRLLFTILKPFFVRNLSKIKDPSDFIIAGQSGILHDALNILPQLKMPTLLITGTNDRFFPEALFYEMKKHIPRCDLLMIPNAKHGVFEENKKKCLKAMIPFLKSEKIASSYDSFVR